MKYFIYFISVLLELVFAIEIVICFKQRKSIKKSLNLVIIFALIILFILSIITSKLYYNYLLNKSGIVFNLLILIPLFVFVFMPINDKIKKIFYSKITIITLMFPSAFMLAGLVYAIINF